MSKLIKFSRLFPSYHPRVGEPTFFAEKMLHYFGIAYWHYSYLDLLVKLNDPSKEEICLKFYQSLAVVPLSVMGNKSHTIRSGNRFKEGEMFSPTVWAGIPYKSKSIVFAPDTKIMKTWKYCMKIGIDAKHRMPFQQSLVNCIPTDSMIICQNDGLDFYDFLNWFNRPFEGQIICWNSNINY